MSAKDPLPSFPWPSRPELRWAALFAAAFMLLTCLPYLFGLYLRQPGWYYSGLLTNPDDHNVYLSYLRQAHDGRVFFTDMFTTEHQPSRLVNVYFLIFGFGARLAHLPLPIAYHLARVVSGWLLLMSVYWLASQVLAGVASRRIALALVATASGLGWLFRAQGGQPHPIDYGPGLVMPEAITFLTLLLNPLFAFSMLLMVATLGLAVHAFASGSFRSAALAGLSALVLGNIHSYDLIPVGAVLAVYLLFALLTRRAPPRALLLAALIGLIASPALLHQLWLRSMGDMTIIVKLVGPPALAPPARYLALGLGLPLGLAAVAAAKALSRGSSDATRLLAIWLVVGFALVFAPVPFNRKLAEGLHVPVCLLAVAAVEPLWRPLPRRAWQLGAVLILLCLPSNVLYLKRAVGDLIANNQTYVVNLMPPLYLRRDQYQALRALDDAASPSDILLANTFLSSYAPSIAGVRVYLGHWSETLHYQDRKVNELAAFLRAGTPDAEREAFCREEGITYVVRDRTIYDSIFLPPAERAAGGFDPDGSAWLSRVYQRDRVSIYRVK